MKTDNKVALIKSIRNIWDSLDSHLDYIVDPVKPKKFRKIHGGPRFHAKTVREYAEDLVTLTKQL